MRCVPISPLVLAPQTKKLPASSQKSRDCRPTPKAPIAAANGFPVAGGDSSTSWLSPYRRSPMSDGLSRMKTATIGTTNIATPATIQAAGLQPYRSTTTASIGRNTS